MPMKHLDEDGRAIVKLANDIAHEFEQEYVGTEHVLLAILRHNNGPGAAALHTLSVSEDKARRIIDRLLQRSKEDTWVLGRLPGSPHYCNVIERAMEIAEQLESKLIGSAHLLLALFHEEETIARQTLAALDVTPRKCRDAVLRQLSQT